jgi:hypothetical protein
MPKRAPRRVVDGIQEKQCTGECACFLPETPEYFYDRTDGSLYSQCKPCWKSYLSNRDKAAKTGAVEQHEAAFEGPELEGAELAAYRINCRIVESFDAYRGLDLLTYGWGKTPSAAYTAALERTAA